MKILLHKFLGKLMKTITVTLMFLFVFNSSVKSQTVSLTFQNIGQVPYMRMQIASIANVCVLFPSTDFYYNFNYSGNQHIAGIYVNYYRDISLEGLVPGYWYYLSCQFRNLGWGCDYSQYPTYYFQVPSYQPVSNVQATDNLYGNKVVVTWDLIPELLYTNRHYRVYCNGVNVSGNLGAGTKSFQHQNLPKGFSGTYVVKAVVNWVEMSAPTSNAGSTFNIDLNATTDDASQVALTWTDFSGISGATGYIIDRYDGTYNTQIKDHNFITYTSYLDNSSSLIPGFMYRYIISVKPYPATGVIDTAWGKLKPNGKIKGFVKTPATPNNPAGVGVPGVKITATLQGATLPTDTTRTYITYTDAGGAYEIPEIYYYNSAVFYVVPDLGGRSFSPSFDSALLDLANPLKNLNFTDLSSFTVSGTIMQDGCPMEGVHVLLDGDSTNVFTNKEGKYDLTISSGGNYTIKPLLENHIFIPSSKLIAVTANKTGVDFVDSTYYTLEGRISASCNTYIGVAKLHFYSTDSTCFNDSVTTDSTGYYSIKLPARKLNVDVTDFKSFNETLLKSVEVLAYFYQTLSIDLTLYDSQTFHNDTSVLNFIYRLPPKLTMSGLNKHVTCSGPVIPVLQQHASQLLEFEALEAFLSTTCPAGDGYIVLNENISSNGVDVMTDTIFYKQGDTIRYTFEIGAPNIISPFKKFIEAILFRDGQTDTVYYDVIVVGHRPRAQTFTTTTPEIPFHILHNPPGDGSYSYLEKNSSISNSFTTSYLQDGSVNTYIRAQLGPSFSVEVGFVAGVSTEISNQLDITGSFGVGASGLTEDATLITTSTTDKFQTAGNGDITGSAGDVYIGGAINMLYAVSDVLLYNFSTCQIEQSKTLMMQPNGLATTFMYTENHITDVIIPDLEDIRDYYIDINKPDTAAYYENQRNLWQQVIDTNHQNILEADFIENKTFSGGLVYENTVETTRSESHTFDFSFYIDYGVAVDVGASVGGVGLYGGVEVKGQSQWGNVSSIETTQTTTVGYVLADDDNGDSYTIDIKEDKAYGVPAFKLVAGRSKCPWEQGTLPREGVQLIADKYSQTVEETKAAVYTLQLANTSQSNETMTYDLVFDHTSNPDGAVLTIGGSPIVGNVPYPYTIDAGKGTNATITVSKGPIAYSYKGLKFTLKSSCDDQIYDDVFLNTEFFHIYDLTVAINGSGTTNPVPATYKHPDGKSVVLYASPAKGYIFEKWVVGSEVYKKQAILVVMDTHKTATAYFVATVYPQFDLTIANIGNGSSIPPVGTHYVIKDSSISLVALPDLNNAFVKWVIDGNELTNNQTNVTITKNTTASAYFIQTYALNVEVAKGQGITTPPVGSHIYHEGTKVYLYANQSP
jgi:hypothetical protein